MVGLTQKNFYYDISWKLCSGTRFGCFGDWWWLVRFQFLPNNATAHSVFFFLSLSLALILARVSSISLVLQLKWMRMSCMYFFFVFVASSISFVGLQRVQSFCRSACTIPEAHALHFMVYYIHVKQSDLCISCLRSTRKRSETLLGMIVWLRWP